MSPEDSGVSAGAEPGVSMSGLYQDRLGEKDPGGRADIEHSSHKLRNMWDRARKGDLYTHIETLNTHSVTHAHTLKCTHTCRYTHPHIHTGTHKHIHILMLSQTH